MLSDALLYTGLYLSGIAVTNAKRVGVGVRYTLASAAPLAYASGVGAGFTTGLMLVPVTVGLAWWLERTQPVLFASLVLAMLYVIFGAASLLFILGAALSVWLGNSPYRWELPSRNSPTYWAFLTYILLGTILWTF